MHLDAFELHRPASLQEALELARAHAGEFDYLAGGTDLLPNYKMHLNLRPHLIALEDVPELRGISPGRIGAMTRLADLERDGRLARDCPAVVEAAAEVATPLVRASGTLGGNLLVETRCFFFNQSAPWRESLGFCLKAEGDRCHVVPQKARCYATFSGDLAPALAVHDAEVEIAGPSTRRRIPVETLYDLEGDGIRRHHLAPGELVVAVHLPETGRARRSTYRKLRVRPSFDFPELGVAAAARVEQGTVRELRLALGGLETHPRRFDAVTDRLIGRPITPAEIRAASDEVMRASRPVYNTFLAPDYRKRMTGVFVRRALERVLGPEGAAG